MLLRRLPTLPLRAAPSSSPCCAHIARALSARAAPSEPPPARHVPLRVKRGAALARVRAPPAPHHAASPHRALKMSPLCPQKAEYFGKQVWLVDARNKARDTPLLGPVHRC